MVATTSLSHTRVLGLGPARAPLQGKNSGVLWDVAEVAPENESGGADLVGCQNYQKRCASGPGWAKKGAARTSLRLSPWYPALPPSTLELSVNKTSISRALELVCMLLY